MWGPQYHPGVICSETSQDPAVRSRLWFVTVKGHKAKPVMGKGVWDEVWREAGTAPRVLSLLPWDRTNGSSPELWQHMWNEVFQGSSWRLDAENLTVCLVRAKTSDSGRKAGFSINYTVCINCSATVSHSYRGMMGALLNPKFPDASQGPRGK